MALIKLTTTDYDRGGETIGQRPVWINPDHIVAVAPLPTAERYPDPGAAFPQFDPHDSLAPKTRVYIEGNVGAILVIEPEVDVVTKMIDAHNRAKL